MLTSWRYMWRTTPYHRSEVNGALPGDAAPEIAPGVARDELQIDGAGPLFHRVYRARIRETELAPEALIAAIVATSTASRRASSPASTRCSATTA